MDDEGASFTAQIPLSEKTISPRPMGLLDDGRVLLALDAPGPELLGSARGGDYERMIAFRFKKGVPKSLEILKRRDAIPRLRAQRDMNMFKM